MSNNTLVFGQIYNIQVNLINTNRWLNVFVVFLYFENERFSQLVVLHIEHYCME